MLTKISDYSKFQEMCNKLVEKDPEILEFVPNHFKTHKICVKVFQNLLFVIIHVLDEYKTGQMCEKVILENPWMLGVIPNHYKIQNMCEKAVNCFPITFSWNMFPIAVKLKNYKTIKPLYAEILAR